MPTPRKAPVEPPVETPQWRSNPQRAVASNGKLLDVQIVESTPTQTTPRRASLRHQPRQWPVASNGKLLDVTIVGETPAKQRQRPQRQPTQNVAIKERGKLVSVFLSFCMCFRLPEEVGQNYFKFDYLQMFHQVSHQGSSMLKGNLFLVRVGGELLLDLHVKFVLSTFRGFKTYLHLVDSDKKWD